MTVEPIIFHAKIETRWGRLLLLFVWTLLCLTSIGILLYGFTTNTEYIDDLIVPLILMAIAAGLAINYIRWQLCGVETLILTVTDVEIRNNGTIFKRFIRINYSEVESITFDDDKATPCWIKWWGIGGGKIIIEYLGWKRRFGRDLSPNQAEKMAGEIRMGLEKVQS